MPDAGAWDARGVTTSPDFPDGQFDIAIVHLPRAKAAALDMIARACRVAGRVVVDGAKTDGIEALQKDVKTRAALGGTISKAHGKLFWFEAIDLSDWQAAPGVIEGHWHVQPGVFSADGIDPGSALLAAALPQTLAGTVADLGAGWGYLGAVALERAQKIDTLHLVEAQASALDCARRNVSDDRAEFHWADATTWGKAGSCNVVLMNPPFHAGRAADTALGQRFIANAARLLRKGGTLWMVANRHLPYETTLRDHFGDVTEGAGGDTRYKLFTARKLR